MDRKAIFYFISCQISYIRNNGGLPVLLKKILTLLLSILAMPLVLILRLLKPFIIIRFGVLPSERLGHLAVNTELYLCERDNGMHNPRNFDIFYNNSQISNYQLMKMWSRLLRISNFAKFLDKANRLLPGGKSHIVPMDSCRDRDGLLAVTNAHLSFLPKEGESGKKAIARLGVKEDSPFVCFHARDPAYLNNMNKRKNDWRYHSYRDSDIFNYLPAVNMLTAKGYYGIRMGAATAKPLDTPNEKIIDYAVKQRTDFLDIYLLSKCSFFLGDTAGIYAVSELFRKPIAWVNHIPLEATPTWSKDYIFIPKKLWSKENKRFLTFKEILDSGIGRFTQTQQYEKANIEVIENTPDEILALVTEIEQRIKGSWQAKKEEEELQECFWNLFKASGLSKVYLSRIGTEFLRQNQELLR